VASSHHHPDGGQFEEIIINSWLSSYKVIKNKYLVLFLNEYPAACCGWDGQETDLRKAA
jgi:hypothetical protein